MSTPGYQRRTMWAHLALALLCLLALPWAPPSWVGLLLTAAVNLVIAWEKWDLVRKGDA